MYRLGKILLGFIGALICLSCATPAQQPPKEWTAALSHPNTLKLPYTLTETGQYLVNVGLGDERAHIMVIDTGATQSAVYAHVVEQVDVPLSGQDIHIHGMVKSGLRPELILPSMEIGGQKLQDISVAVLESYRKDTASSELYSGIIGLDILSQYFVYFDSEASQVYLIPNNQTGLSSPIGWLRVPLSDNPFRDDQKQLKFLDIRVTGRVVPALLDTGSGINAISWSALNHPVIKVEKRRLQRNWKLRGAIGEFDPKLKVNIRNFRSGQKHWILHEFIVLNFESLEVLGVDQQPFIIAGAPMFSNQSYWLDLQSNEMFIKPVAKKDRPRQLPEN